MNQPAIGQNQIAFIYAEYLQGANSDGTNPKRLTISNGTKSNPHFSPDGNWIAICGQYIPSIIQTSGRNAKILDYILPWIFQVGQHNLFSKKSNPFSFILTSKHFFPFTV